MGTVDFALGRDTIAMKLCLLALVLPLAAAMDMTQMMQMMQMMNMAKGWGSENANMGGSVMQQQMNQQQQWQSMMAQWKSWEQKMKMSTNFEHMGVEIMEVKGKYYYMVVNEFLKFCKCTDRASQIQAFFGSNEVSDNKMDYEEFDLSDLGITEAQSNDPVAVARALLGVSQEDQVKAYFSGPAMSMCEAANAYYDQVETWEKQ